MARPQELSTAAAFGRCLESTRRTADLSQRKLAKRSGISVRRIDELEQGAAEPTDRELGALAQACRVSVFELLPAGYTLRVLAQDESTGVRELEGGEASDALLREYLSMVVELRSGRPVTPPTLRHDDLVELAAALGDSPEAIEARLVSVLDADESTAPAIRSLILPSTSDE
jgi:transcriptional regulator with XRE-family HTH domain